MPRRARLAMDLLLGALALLAVLAAVLHTALYVALPGLSAHGARIEALASRALGHELRYASMDAGMAGVTPRVRFRDVTLTGTNGVATHLELLDLRVALLRSAWARELRFADVRAAGLALDVRRDRDGRWWVGGIAVGGGSKSDLGDWLLAWPRAHLDNATLAVRDERSGRQVTVAVRTLDLRRQGAEHLVRGFVDLDGALRGRAAVAAQARDLDGAMDTARWRLAARMDRVQSEDVVVRGLHLAQPLLTGTVHLRGTGPRLARVSGSLAADARLSTETADAGVRHARVRGVWQRREQGWVLGLDRASLGPEDAQVDLRELLVEHNPAGEEPWRARAGRVLLPADAPLWALAASWHPLLRSIGGLAPAVGVRDVALATDAHGPRAAARLDELRWAARGDRVGLSGIAGTLRADRNGATLALDSGAVDLNLPKLYRQPLRIETPRGSAVLRRDEGVWEVAVPQARGEVRDLPVSAALRLRLGSVRTLGLTLASADLAAVQVAALLPDARIKPPVLEWYGKAVQSGQVRSPRLLLYGPLGRFFRDGVDARFLLEARFEDVDLDYRPGAGWPPLRQVDGVFSIDGRTVQAVGAGAGLWKSTVDTVSATLPDFKAPQKVLAVQADAHGDAGELLRLVRETPLRARVGSDLAGLDVAGPARTALELAVHFQSPVRVVVKARTDVSGARVVAPGAVVEDLSGALNLSGGALHGDDLEGSFLGGRARFGIQAGGADGVRVTAAGKAPAAGLAARIGAGQGADGAAGWQGTLAIRGGETSIHAALDLGDVAVAVPAPLGKARGEPGLLEFDLRCCAAPGRWALAAELPGDGRVRAELVAGQGRLEVARGELALGVAPALPDHGVRVRARLPAVDADPWIAWARALAGAPDRPALSLTGIEVHADALTLAGRVLANQRVRLTPGPRWTFAFDGPQLAGSATLGLAQGGALGFDFSRLHWPGPAPAARAALPPAPQTSPDPARFPVLSGRVDDLRYDGRALGVLELHSTRSAGGLAFERVVLTAPSGQVSGSGAWEKTAVGTQTQVSGTLRATDLGGFLRATGLGGGVERGNGEVVFDAGWAGGPQAFAMARASGQARLRVTDASLPDIEPGLGRLLGVLSLETLQRRLMLDFRDLFGRGFAVDEIRGEVQFMDGTARTQELRVRGPAAHLTLSGDVHLPSRALDLSVSVVPQLTSSLPAAVAIGSLGVGAAIFIGQRLLGETINEMTAQTYRVLGTVDTPQVNRAPGP